MSHLRRVLPCAPIATSEYRGASGLAWLCNHGSRCHRTSWKFSTRRGPHAAPSDRHWLHRGRAWTGSRSSEGRSNRQPPLRNNMKEGREAKNKAQEQLSSEGFVHSIQGKKNARTPVSVRSRLSVIESLSVAFPEKRPLVALNYRR